MFRRLTCVALYMMTFHFISAQGLDVGLGIGGSGYFGDLSRQEFFKDATDVNLGFEGEVTYQFNRWVAATLSFNYLSVDGSDLNHPDSLSRLRNLDFRSKVYELALMGEYHFLGNVDMESDIFFSPYVTLGIAGFKYNPVTDFEGTTYDLQPLGTEGQGIEGFDKKYNLNAISIPYGLGVKFRIRHPFAIKFDIIGRYTFTDYLDDVSGGYVDRDVLEEAYGPISYQLSDRRVEPTYSGQRGRSSANDHYFTYMLTFVYNIYSSGRSGIFCPTVEKPQF